MLIIYILFFFFKVEYLVVQVEQQVSDDELPLVCRDEFWRAGGEDGLHQTPPALQSVTLGTETAPHVVPLHHLLQDWIHLLMGWRQRQDSQRQKTLFFLAFKYKPTSISSGLWPMAAMPCSALISATKTRCSNCKTGIRKIINRVLIEKILRKVFLLKWAVTHLISYMTRHVLTNLCLAIIYL